MGLYTSKEGIWDFVKKVHFRMAYPPDLLLPLLFSLTLRFSWIEDVAGRNSGEPYASKNEFWKCYFWHGRSGTHLLGGYKQKQSLNLMFTDTRINCTLTLWMFFDVKMSLTFPNLSVFWHFYDIYKLSSKHLLNIIWRTSGFRCRIVEWEGSFKHLMQHVGRA